MSPDSEPLIAAKTCPGQGSLPLPRRARLGGGLDGGLAVLHALELLQAELRQRHLVLEPARAGLGNGRQEHR